MAAQRVEPHGLGVAETLLEKIRVGWTAFLLRVPVLVERADEKERLAVENKLALFGLEAAEADRPLEPRPRTAPSRRSSTATS